VHELGYADHKGIGCLISMTSRLLYLFFFAGLGVGFGPDVGRKRGESIFLVLFY
jgi:hypothetical protein